MRLNNLVNEFDFFEIDLLDIDSVSSVDFLIFDWEILWFESIEILDELFIFCESFLNFKIKIMEKFLNFY